MKIVVIGATGNVGSAIMRALAGDPAGHDVVGVARRLPVADFQPAPGAPGRVSWTTADISVDPLDVVAGADAVIVVAWKLQPSRDEAEQLLTNVHGTRRVLDAVLRHHVPAFVYASSVGAYAPSPKSPPVDESWPVTGVPTSTYSRHKAMVEAVLDDVEAVAPNLRIVRLRTSLVFQAAAASEIHRIFLGSLLPWGIPRWLRLIPRTRRLQFQATHADDIADAYVRAATRDVRGAFNIAATPVLSSREIAVAVGGRSVPLPERVLRWLAGASYVLRIQPTEAGWVDLAMQTPLMDVTRATDELGWAPRHSATDALVELLTGMGQGSGAGTEPLHPR